ncbi:MAG: hypothetical protein DRQ02_09565 [Candidatus Latescibacterota bacterium]|nr:MAG: hypothetical protein DRQ02_09565 [Candidatus Latescibacterota bacterium]RKY70753.1 MAG: hypothetical protein DRQ24_08675 [Candidatus Latescibacterota bacterium]
MDGLTIKYDPTMDKAVEIAKENIRMCMGHNPCDCRGVTPNPPGRFYRGVWVQDSLWTYCDALLYWPDIDEEELRDYLYSEVPGHMGVIPFFTRAQERSGRYRGNVPTARWEKRYSNPGIDYLGGRWDLGGYFDLAYSPRRNLRDIVQEGAFLVHAMYQYWKFFDDAE